MQIAPNAPRFSMHKFYSDVRDNSVSLAFQGIMSQEVLSLIALALRRRPDNEVLAKRLFGIVVELAQNIYHYSHSKSYSEKDKRDIGVGVITIGETQTHYVVNSGNIIKIHEAEPITKRCDFINTLDKEGLKEFQKQVRKDPQRPDKPGANIGLIELARRSSNLLGYSINPIDAQTCFLTLSIKIDK